MTLAQTITDQFNFIKDTEKAFGVIPNAAGIATIIDLGKTHHYNHLKAVNTTDQDVILTFTNSSTTSTYTIKSNSVEVNDEFSHNDIIKYNYVGGVAPLVGYFKLTSYLGKQT